jgi:hypothetical protein
MKSLSIPAVRSASREKFDSIRKGHSFLKKSIIFLIATWWYNLSRSFYFIVDSISDGQSNKL